MKLVFYFFGLVASKCNCMVKVSSREECQQMCDLNSYCEAWTMRKSDKVCYFKKREGWTAISDSNRESGFKNQGPWYEENTDFSQGDYLC